MQSRLEGCVFYDTDLQESQEISPVSVGWKGVPVCMPPIWSVHGPLGIHKTDEGALDQLEKPGHSPSLLHRRHPDFGGVVGGGCPSTATSCVPFGITGLHDQHQENISTSFTAGCLSGFCSRLSEDVYQPPRGESSKGRTGGGKDATSSVSLSSPVSSPNRPVLLDNSSCPSSSSELPGPSSSEERSCGFRGLQQCGSPLPPSPRQLAMVEEQPCHHEWSAPPERPAIFSDCLRCLSLRMGSDIRECQHRGSLVRPGKVIPHKPAGAAGSFICCEGLHKLRAVKGTPQNQGDSLGLALPDRRKFTHLVKADRQSNEVGALLPQIAS